MTKLKFGVIGCGRFGMKRINSILQSDMAELKCVIDIDKNKAEQTGKKFSVNYYSDVEKAFKKENIDCVIIAVPNVYHSQIGTIAIEYGINVWCEKPLAVSSKEAKNLVKKAKKADIFLKTGSNLRYFSNITKSKQLLENNKIGDIIFIRGFIGHDGSLTANSWFTNKKLSGGGTLLDNGAHLVDLVIWFLNKDFKKLKIAGLKTTLYHDIEVEDNGIGIIRDDKRIVSIHSSWTEWSGYMYMEIYGSEGYIKIDNRRSKSMLMVSDRRGVVEKIYDYSLEPPTSYKRELEDYIYKVSKGEQPMASGEDGLKVVKIIEAFYESSEKGKFVELEL